MKKYAAEGGGTFVLVFTGRGAAVFAGDRIGTIGIAAVFGLAFPAMAHAVGPISGCHLNPAIMIGALTARRSRPSSSGSSRAD